MENYTTAAAQSAGASNAQGSGTPQIESGTRLVPGRNNLGSVVSRPPDGDNLNDAAGRRVRLRPKPSDVARNLIYGNPPGLMTPLLTTRGMLWPYQPLITYQQEVLYSQMEMTHTNQDFYSYTRTPALKLTVEGEFTCQNELEGKYSLACIHFLRTVSKMWFGGSSEQAVERQGTPPPVLLFDAYGQYMFNNLPVIVTQFSVTLPKDVDYFPVPVEPTSNITNAPRAATEYTHIFNPNRKNLAPAGSSTGYAWLPVLFNISVQLTVQNTPRKLRTFDMKSFSTGELIKGGGWV